MLNIDQIRTYAVHAKIDMYSVLREYIQLAFLMTWNRGENVKKTYFKGGTCLRLIFGSGRFSEDLDFTTDLSSVQIDSALKNTLGLLQLEFPGMTMKSIPSPAGFSHKIQLQTDIATQPLSIKLDFSTRETVLEPEASTPKTDFPFAILIPVSHISLKEILAEKVRAITSRTKGRDLYDLYYLLGRNVPFDREFIQKKMDYYGETFTIEKVRNGIENWNLKNLKNDLGPFLPKDIRHVIEDLPEMTLKLLRNYE